MAADRQKGGSVRERPTLTRDVIVAQAVELADDEGMAALSMRALATRLGVEAMSLYHHVASKDVLLDAMIDVVFTEIHLPRVGRPWRAEMRERAVSARAALLRHRWAVGQMDARRQPGPASIAHHDAVLGCLLSDGFDTRSAGTAFALLDAHLYGFVLQEVALPFESEADLAELVETIISPEVRTAFPHFSAFAQGQALQPGYTFGREFEPTLDLTLDAAGRLRTDG